MTSEFNSVGVLVLVALVMLVVLGEYLYSLISTI